MKLLKRLAHLRSVFTVRRQAQIVLILCESILTISRTKENVSGEQMSVSQIRIQLNCQCDLTRSFDRFSFSQIETAKRKVALPGTILDSQALAQSLLRIIGSLLLQVQLAQSKPGIGYLRIDLDRASQRNFGFIPPFQIHVSHAQP